jgi:hypothetical protein
LIVRLHEIFLAKNKGTFSEWCKIPQAGNNKCNSHFFCIIHCWHKDEKKKKTRASFWGIFFEFFLNKNQASKKA